MKRHRLAFHHFLFVLFLCTATLWWQCGAESGLRIRTATCEYLKNPVGIDVSRPRFSWTFSATGRGQKQTAYQLLVARDPELLRKNRADQWDSERSIRTSPPTFAMPANPCAVTRLIIGSASLGWTIPSLCIQQSAEVTTAFLTPDQWQAQWIGRPGGKDPVNEQGFYNQPLAVNEEGDSIRYNPRSLLLRKSFLLQRPVKQALLYVSGLGYYELNVNGEKIGDQVLAPAKTFYKKVVLYDAYDVSAQIRPGANALALMLGNGWFNPLPKMVVLGMQWYGANGRCSSLSSFFKTAARRCCV
jgi:alpha-L-rhamnosidase